jgi:hypothetical protein
MRGDTPPCLSLARAVVAGRCVCAARFQLICRTDISDQDQISEPVALYDRNPLRAAASRRFRPHLSSKIVSRADEGHVLTLRLLVSGR